MTKFFDKYVPCVLDDFFIADNTKKILRVLIELDNLNILLIGDSGTGKTTLIEVLLNEYYKGVSTNEMIMYINVLKDQGIHSFRQNIKTFCQTTNNLSCKKTIVIDNIDQINDQTQQIIRNNIDKYKHRVNFLLSCSNIQKVLDNLQSRVNIIKLYNVDLSQISSYAKHICKNENISIDDNALEYLVNVSNNSIRLLLSNLFKILLLREHITLEKIQNISTQISYIFFEQYTKLWLEDKDVVSSGKMIMSLTEYGYSVMDILETYFHYIKSISTIDVKYKFAVLPIICKYINVFHSVHEDTFELLLFNYELQGVVNE